MTNIEVLKLFIEKEPHLIAELFDDFYCIGFNSGNYAANHQDLDPDFDFIENITSEDWLYQKYDTDIFRETDVARLLKGN